MSKQMSGTWRYERRRMFDPKTVTTSKTITPFERLLLMFKPMRVSVDELDGVIAVTSYKKLRGIVYILQVSKSNRAIERIESDE